jgi:hypothetical protein
MEKQRIGHFHESNGRKSGCENEDGPQKIPERLYGKHRAEHRFLTSCTCRLKQFQRLPLTTANTRQQLSVKKKITP